MKKTINIEQSRYNFIKQQTFGMDTNKYFDFLIDYMREQQIRLIHFKSDILMLFAIAHNINTFKRPSLKCSCITLSLNYYQHNIFEFLFSTSKNGGIINTNLNADAIFSIKYIVDKIGHLSIEELHKLTLISANDFNKSNSYRLSLEKFYPDMIRSSEIIVNPKMIQKRYDTKWFQELDKKNSLQLTSFLQNLYLF